MEGGNGSFVIATPNNPISTGTFDLSLADSYFGGKSNNHVYLMPEKKRVIMLFGSGAAIP